MDRNALYFSIDSIATPKDYTNVKPKSINALESALAFLPRCNTLLALGYRYGVDAVSGPAFLKEMKS